MRATPSPSLHEPRRPVSCRARCSAVRGNVPSLEHARPLFDSMNLTVFDAPCKWNHAITSPLRLACSAYHHVPKGHPRRHILQKVLSNSPKRVSACMSSSACLRGDSCRFCACCWVGSFQPPCSCWAGLAPSLGATRSPVPGLPTLGLASGKEGPPCEGESGPAGSAVSWALASFSSPVLHRPGGRTWPEGHSLRNVVTWQSHASGPRHCPPGRTVFEKNPLHSA